MPERRCAACGGSPTDEGPFPCAECHRLLGVCRSCGWCVRLFEAGDPCDCEGCGWTPRGDLSEEEAQAEKRLYESIGRLVQNQAQMRAKAGPIYERARAGSRYVGSAWRSAGKPRAVHLVHTPEGPVWFKWGRSADFASWERATEEEVEAWHAWLRQREDLRSELGPPAD